MKNLTINAIYDDAVLGSVPIADADDVERALATAASLHADKSAWLALHQRVAILERLAQLIHERKQELALQAAREGGKPLADSLVETERAIDGVKVCIEVIRHDHGSVIARSAEYTYELQSLMRHSYAVLCLTKTSN